MQWLQPNELTHWGHAWRRRGEVIGFTNGCFDLLHPGHVHLLRETRSLCDRLVVAVNADESVRSLKGFSRPIQPDWLRADLAGWMARADAVVVFNDPTPAALLRDLRPDVLVKGSDYAITDLAGAEFAGRIVLVEQLPGHSTSNSVAKLREALDRIIHGL